jgi:glycosyltransferase involved in cell wall biosynthesis
VLIFYLFFLLTSVVYVWQVLQYYYYWKKTPLVKTKSIQTTESISIIIAVRNEAKNIKACIDSILQQTFTDFEILVIDDFSDDQTSAIVMAFNDPRVKYFQLKDSLPDCAANTMNKKTAIELGVRQSNFNLIVTTDGDCTMGQAWLQVISDTFLNPTIQYATGIVTYYGNPDLFSKFQQIDLMSLMGITAASIQMKSAYMSNGANMAFRKTTFDRIDGYKSNIDLPTGDDVFLMHNIISTYGSNAVTFIKNLDAAVHTASCVTLAEFVQQRIRWVSKSTKLISKKATLTLQFMYIYHSLFLVLLILSLFLDGNHWPYLLGFFIIKISIDLLFLNSVSSFFKRRELLIGLPLFEIFYFAYVIVIGVLGIKGTYEWKSRRI